MDNCLKEISAIPPNQEICILGAGKGGIALLATGIFICDSIKTTPS